MRISGGETLLVTIGDEAERWTVSAVDSRVVKLFDENGNYRQMPYANLQEMVVQGHVKVLERPLP